MEHERQMQARQRLEAEARRRLGRCCLYLKIDKYTLISTQ